MPFDIADNITPRYVILEICYPVVHLDLISVIRRLCCHDHGGTVR